MLKAAFLWRKCKEGLGKTCHELLMGRNLNYILKGSILFDHCRASVNSALLLSLLLVWLHRESIN